MEQEREPGLLHLGVRKGLRTGPGLRDAGPGVEWWLQT